MRLEDYLEANSLKPAEFAARMGKPASTITRLLNGERDPSIALLRDINDATGGQVTPNDFLERKKAKSEEAAA